VSDQLQSIGGVKVLVAAADGPPVGATTVLDLVGDALGRAAEWIVLPVARLDPDFFSLRSGVAGDVVQKLANYRLRLAVLGDIASLTDASTALRDWVREANRGSTVWFVADLDELAGRLAGRR
jgi:fructokinase